MATVAKRTRLSKDGKTEYQIEYKIRSAGWLSEYRLRGGTRGTWTKWFRTQDIYLLLDKLGFMEQGFTAVPATLLNDFYFESHFGRGQIQINYPMFKAIALNVGTNDTCTELYAAVKQLSTDRWIIPASALTTKRVYDHLERVMVRNNE